MALIQIEPYIIDTTGDFTFNTVNATGNLSSLNANLGNLAVANYLTGTLTTNAQPNITSTGTLTSLTVSGTSNLGPVGNVTITGGSNGQYLQTNGAGNLSWSTVVSGSTSNISNGNSNVNIPSANGNINFSAVGNANVVVITGTGINVAGTLNATGNANVGNLGATGVVATTLTGTLATAAQPNITSVGTLTSLVVSGTGSFSGNVNLNNFNINSLATPVASTDAATKQYVDDVAQGLNVHDAVAAATTDTLATITSGTITYNNGSSGVGANLTTTGSFNLIDGVNVQTSGTRILVKNEANAVHNGIYTWSNTTVITRATDYNSVPEVEAGDFVFVTGGTLYDNTGWVQTSTVTAIGTAGNNIEFTQFSGAGTYQAGTGLTLTGTTFSVNANQSQVTTVGTLGNLTVTGNITAGNVVTSGSGGNITGGNVISANTFTASGNITASNANLGNAASANYFIGNFYGTANSATTAGTVTTAAQSNITSVGSLTGLTVSNATGIVDFTTTANVTLGAVANLHITGGTNGYVLQTDGTGNLSWVVQGGASSSLSNGNSNVNIPTANGNINFTAAGNTTAVISGTGVNVAGTLNATGNIAFTGANISLGNVGNVRITGGTANYVLKTDGAGNLDWVAQSGGNAANVTVDNFTGNGVQTIFTLSTTPIGINQTSVNYNGATVLRTDYTLANANITFSSAPANGSYIEVTTINLTTGSGGGSALTIQDEGSNLTTTASLINFVGDGIAATNVGNSVTVTVNTSGATSARALGYSLIFGG